MRIISVELFKADIAYHAPFRIAISESTSTENVFVRLTTDAGFYGMGEASPTRAIVGETQASVVETAKELSPLFLGSDPLDIEGLVRRMDACRGGQPTCKSAFDMALYDLAGKIQGLPLYAVLGGGKRDFWTDNTIGIDTPEVMAKKAAVFQAERYQAIKVKLGTNRDDDIDRIRAIRAAVGDEIPLRIDANQGWDYQTAIAVLRALEPMGIEYCEQPVAHWDYANMKRIRERTTIPIMADESVFDHHDAFKLATQGCVDYINLKLAKSGGIHKALKINAVAEAAGIACMVGSMSETRLGLSAAAHLVSARPNIRFADLDTHFDHAIDPVVGGVEIDGAGVRLTDTPGHGADIDPGYLDACESVKID